MSDYYSIQEMVGDEFAWHYPDCGLISGSNWYNVILKVETNAAGWLGWVERLARGTQTLCAILSANSEGLRVFIALDQFTVFLPWSELTMSAERSGSATVIHVCPAAVRSLSLVFHLDDKAADDLFGQRIYS